MVTKYGFLFGYSFFFLFVNFMLVGLAGSIFTNPINAFTIPVCNFGTDILSILGNLLICSGQFITLYFSLFTVSSSFFILQTFLILPFILVLGVIILDWVRGSA